MYGGLWIQLIYLSKFTKSVACITEVKYMLKIINIQLDIAEMTQVHALQMSKLNNYEQIAPYRSIAIAVASPPPIHKAAIPRCKSARSSAFNKVTKIRAPDAPIG